jgi:hypothetical protein
MRTNRGQSWFRRPRDGKIAAHKQALYYRFSFDRRVFRLFNSQLREIRAGSARAAYTEDLDLEDTLTARCAFAIEKFP